MRLKRRVRAETAGIYIRKNIDSHFGWIGGDTVVASLYVLAVVLRFRVFRMVVETFKTFEVESSSMVDNTDPGQSDNSRLLDTSGWKAIVIVNCKVFGCHLNLQLEVRYVASKYRFIVRRYCGRACSLAILGQRNNYPCVFPYYGIQPSLYGYGLWGLSDVNVKSLWVWPLASAM